MSRITWACAVVFAVALTVVVHAQIDNNVPIAGGGGGGTVAAGTVTTTDGGVANSLVVYDTASGVKPMSISYPTALAASTGICGVANCLDWVLTPGVVFFSATSPLNVVGIVAPTAGTMRLNMWNTGSNAVTFTHQDANETTAANRIINGLGDATGNVVVGGGQYISFTYDYTAARWRGGASTSPSGVLPLTGGTLTGQVVFSNVATDISTGTNENLTLAPNGSGQVIISSAQLSTNTVAFDQQGAVSNSTSNTCNSDTAGAVCVLDTAFSVTSATAQTSVAVWATATTNNTGRVNLFGNGTGFAGSFLFTGTPGAPTQAGDFTYYAASFADADYANKVAVSSISKTITLIRSDDVAAGTAVMEIRDNAGASGVQLFTVDGTGNVFLNATATRSKGSCTLNGGTPSTCTATVVAASKCQCTPVGTTAAIAAAGCAASLSATTLTLTSGATLSNDVNYQCW